MASESPHLPRTMSTDLLIRSNSHQPVFLQQPTPDEDIEDAGPSQDDYDDLYRHDHDHSRLRNRYRRDYEESEQNISIPASSKQAEKTVAPFLAKHIPVLHHPVGVASRTPQAQQHKLEPGTQRMQPKNNTKFCYRHHPDLKCRRQANEPSMEQLQNELATLSQSDQQAISHVWSLFSAAPAKHRNLMLQGILTQCCFPQLSFISANVRDLIKIDFLSALPAELGFRILCYLDTTSLCKAAQVSTRWRELADDDVVWHKMCEQHIDRKCTKCGWGLPLLERKRLRTEKRQIQLRATGRGLNQWSPNITPIPEEFGDSAEVIGSTVEPIPSSESGIKRSADVAALPDRLTKKPRTMASDESSQESGDSYFRSRKRPWKDIYKDRFKVGTAWKYGRCTTKVFRGHSNGVMCLQFDENVLITGSYDTTVKVWDIESGAELRTLTGHTSGIRCLQFDDNKLMTGSLDNTLRLWNWKTGQCLRTFSAHTDGIISLHFAGRYVATGSMDKTVRVWDSEGKQTFLLRGHTDWVNCVRIDLASRTLFSASDDLTVLLWDLDTRQEIRRFKGHVGQVQQVVPLPPEFELEENTYTASDNDDDASSVSSFTPQGSHSRYCSVSGPPAPFWPNDPDRPAPPRYMLTGGLDSTIRLWDVHSIDPSGPKVEDVNTFQSHSDGTEAIATDPLNNSHIPRAQACIRTFFGHVEGIWALAADHLRLVSGSEDRMMKVWDPRTGKCERTFVGHAGPVTCAWLSDSRLASGSEDCEVRMLSFGDV